MKIMRFVSLAVVFLSTSQTLIAQETRSIGERTFVREGTSWTQFDPDGRDFDVNPSVISIKFNDNVSIADKKNLHPTIGGTELRRAITGWIDVQIPAGLDVFDAIDAYMASGLIDKAEPNTFGVYHITPDDPSYGSQWHLPQINAEETWDTVTGDPAVIVAVLDSGTEYFHPDLGMGADNYQNIWINDGEDAWTDPNDPSTGNGIDDDGNGWIDDWKGFDFGNDDNDPSSPTSHGSLVAGVLAAKSNNSTGVAGVSGGWNAAGTRVMIGGVGEALPDGSVLDDAILYAIEMGAHVIQLSLTVAMSSNLDDAIQMAVDNNLVVVCSSGNGFASTVGYPSSNPNVMSIGATNESELREGFSNQGPRLEISAPGTNILTTTIGGGYSAVGGTSFSSPIISGVIALMLAVNPGLDNDVIRQILWDTADKIGPYDYNHDPKRPGHSLELGYGRVNARAAIAAAQAMLPLDYKSGFESPAPAE